MVLSLPKNTSGRDFAVGDIHGMFSSLEEILKAVNFDEQNDRVISVGDLIDRGPESHRALEFLEKPWFYAIQGNHERMMLDAVYAQRDTDTWLHINGGGWWLDIKDELKAQFAEVIGQLPLAIEIQASPATVGIVHADVPADLSWEEFMTQLRKRDEKAVTYAVWSRTRLRMQELSGLPSSITGIDLVIVGHTPLKSAVRVGNIYYLDTAAAYSSTYEDSKLSLLEFSPGYELTELPTGSLETLGL
jgi:serine/threonine protein phosphatase 1